MARRLEVVPASGPAPALARVAPARAAIMSAVAVSAVLVCGGAGCHLVFPFGVTGHADDGAAGVEDGDGDRREQGSASDLDTPLPDGKKPLPDGKKPLLDGIKPAPDGKKPAPDKSTPAPDKSTPAPDKSTPAPDKSTPAPDKSTSPPDTGGELDTGGPTCSSCTNGTTSCSSSCANGVSLVCKQSMVANKGFDCSCKEARGMASAPCYTSPKGVTCQQACSTAQTTPACITAIKSKCQ
jgi:hypothetical protein